MFIPHFLIHSLIHNILFMRVLRYSSCVGIPAINFNTNSVSHSVSH